MSEIETAIENLKRQWRTEVHAEIIASLNGGKRGPGRPKKTAESYGLVSGVVAAKKPRKKAPKQLCPAPRCKNVAAPVFGMLCSTHKDLPKAKVRAYRKARAAKKSQ